MRMYKQEREERDLAKWRQGATLDTERMEGQRRADLVTAEKQLKVEKVQFSI